MEPNQDNVRPTTVTRRRTWIAAGIGATASLAMTALLSGVLTGPGPRGPSAGTLGGLLGPAPAAAAELPAFTGCEELRQWYVDAALPHVGPWGLGGGSWELFADRDARAAAESVGGTTDAVGNGATGTNVQEAGVDEPDVAKTDGTYVAHLDGRDLVLTDASEGHAVPRGRLRLPRALAGAELLWVADRIVVLGTLWPRWGGPMPIDTLPSGRAMSPIGGAETTRALVVDVGDPDAPRVEHDATYDGTLVSARQYDDVVRLVVSTGSPALDFVTPQRGRTPREAARENRRLVRESEIGDWLPTVESSGVASPLVECADVRHPEGPPDKRTGYATVSVVGFDADDPEARRTAAVTTGSQLVYSSADRLYLAMSDRGRTEVHAFALDGVGAAYVASGEVPGQVRDRWSMNEYDGHLRVATALGPNPWDPRENAVVLLEERAEVLVEVGRVARMGIRESIRSVRWFGEIAVVVTFRQVDPLYTLDLADPAAPRVLGELKIPGFSAYLHPLGGDLVLGIGQDADRRGMTRGAQASVFDLADLADPRRVATEQLGRHTEFTAAWDPRGLTYLPDRRTVLAPIHDWRGNTRLVTLVVGADGALTRSVSDLSGDRHGGQVRTLPLDDGRVALVVGDRVQVIDLRR